MKKYSSKQGSSLIKTATGFKIKLSKKEWIRLGKEAGWIDEDIVPYEDINPHEFRQYLKGKYEEDKKSNQKYRIKLPYVHRSVIRDEKVYDPIRKRRYNIQKLIDTIKVRPHEILSRNEKIQESGKNANTIYYELGIPAFKGIAVDESKNKLINVSTCPGAGSCVRYCYARKGGYVQFPNSFLSQTRKLNFLINDPQGFKNQIISEIKNRKRLNDRKGLKTAVRWHDSGDFFAKAYFDIANQIASEFPDVQFYAYTKRAEIANNEERKGNFIINFSEDAKKSEEKLVDISITKNSRVIDIEDIELQEGKEFAYRDKAGNIQYNKENLQDFKLYLAKKYNLKVDSIITFDELVKIPYDPSDYLYKPNHHELPEQKKYNVIVKPGDGDDAANRQDVLSTLLIKH